MSYSEVVPQRVTVLSTVSTATIVFPSATPALDDLMIVQITISSPTTLSGSPAGWSSVDQIVSNIHTYVFYKRAGASETNSYTWNFSSPGPFNIIANGVVFTGGTAAPATFFDLSVKAASSSATAQCGATGTLSTSNELNVTSYSIASGSVGISSLDNGQTAMQTGTQGGASASLAYKSVTSNASVNYGANLSASALWSAIDLVFIDTGGGGGGGAVVKSSSYFLVMV